MSKKLLTYFLLVVALLATGCSTKSKKLESQDSEIRELCEVLIDVTTQDKAKSSVVRKDSLRNIGPFTIMVNNVTLRESISYKKGYVIIDSADTIDVKTYKGDYYIFENFQNKKFDQAAIYIYKDKSVNKICDLRKDINLVAKDCYNNEFCEYITNNSRFLYTKKQDMIFDLNNDGVSEQLTFVNKHDKNICDYETYMIDKTKDDVITYLTTKLDYKFDKCFRSISFANYNNLNYIIVESFAYDVTAFFIRDDKAFIAGTFNPQITLKRIY